MVVLAVAAFGGMLTVCIGVTFTGTPCAVDFMLLIEVRAATLNAAGRVGAVLRGVARAPAIRALDEAGLVSPALGGNAVTKHEEGGSEDLFFDHVGGVLDFEDNRGGGRCDVFGSSEPIGGAAKGEVLDAWICLKGG